MATPAEITTDWSREKRFSTGCKNVSLQDWKDSIGQKGETAYGNGVTSDIAKKKVERFLTAFLPHVEKGVSQLPKRGTLEENIKRAEAMIRHNARFRMIGGKPVIKTE